MTVSVAGPQELRHPRNREARAAVMSADKEIPVKLMNVKEKFPGIARAALEIAYDNGGINRGRSEAEMMAELTAFLTKRHVAGHAGLRSVLFSRLVSIDQWLQTQSDETIDTICGGERDEARAAMDGAPEGTDTLLTDIFENVC